MFASKDTLLTRPSGYNIARSVRIRGSASAYFSKTYGTSPTSRTTMTMSAWVKRGKPSDGTNYQTIFGTGSNYENVTFNTDDTIRFTGPYSSAQQGVYVTTQKFRDYSAWYHIVVVYDTTNATATNRMRLYVNGVQVTAFSTQTTSNQNNTTTEWLNSGAVSAIGQTGSGSYFDGYLTEINVIDGQALTPSSFGETDSITGVWKPKAYSGTYGTNGFELNFSDNSNNTAATIGKDYSGNGNNWTPNNISVTAGVTYDSMVDSPTVGSLSSNYAVINPLDTQNASSVAQGNQYISFSAVNYGHSRATMSIPDGSYWEVTAGGSNYLMLGVANSTTYSSFNWAGSWAIYQGDGKVYNNGAAITGVLATFTTNDVIGFAVKGNKLYIAKNNTWLNSGDPVAQTGSVASSLSSEIFPYIGNGGGAAGTPSAYFNAGQRPFSYTPPTGFVALNTYNLPASTIKNGAAYMAATTYTGTGSSLTVANTNGSTSFKPDLVWIKSRSAATDNKLTDSLRGVTKAFISNLADGETTDTQGLTAFNSNGFTVGTNTIYNNSSATYVAWQWQAGQGSSASNTSGSITSTVSKNTTAGFSIVTYSGNSTSGATIGHGLGVTPDLIIVKRLNATLAQSPNAIVYVTPLGNTKGLILDTTLAAQTAAGFWNNTSPTSSVFSVGNDANTNVTSFNYVAYCFSAVAGYSAFGSYTGNSDANGPFIYTGFRPRYVMLKCSSTGGAGYDWYIWDTSRMPYNLINSSDLQADQALVEGASGITVPMDIVSNGFKIRTSSAAINQSTQTFIYMAFAENPFRNALAR